MAGNITHWRIFSDPENHKEITWYNTVDGSVVWVMPEHDTDQYVVEYTPGGDVDAETIDTSSSYRDAKDIARQWMRGHPGEGEVGPTEDDEIHDFFIDRFNTGDMDGEYSARRLNALAAEWVSKHRNIAITRYNLDDDHPYQTEELKPRTTQHNEKIYLKTGIDRGGMFEYSFGPHDTSMAVEAMQRVLESIGVYDDPKALAIARLHMIFGTTDTEDEYIEELNERVREQRDNAGDVEEAILNEVWESAGKRYLNHIKDQTLYDADLHITEA